MATKAIDTSTGFCPSCNSRTSIERDSFVWAWHDLPLTLITCGIWLVVRSIRHLSWRCSQCGSNAKDLNSSMLGTR